MAYHVGLDVSLNSVAVCIVDEDGGFVAETSVDAEPCAIHAFLEDYRDDIVRIGIEAGGTSSWLTEELSALGLPVVCIESAHASRMLKGQINKTDRNDARGLAQIMRSGWYKAVHIKSKESQRLRVLINNRATLINKRKDIDNQIRGTLRTFGLKMGPVTALRFEQRARALLASEPQLLPFIEPLLNVRSVILQQFKTLHGMLLKIVRQDQVCRRLMTVPGVGALTALTFKTSVDRPERFRRSRDVGAHLGLTPRTYASGEVDYNGRITKCGDPLIRSYLYEAAHALLQRVAKPNALKEWGTRIAKCSSMKNAKVAVARKLTVVMHRMWLDGSDFRDPAAVPA